MRARRARTACRTRTARCFAARAGGEAQDVGAQCVRRARVQVRELHVRVVAGDRHFELRCAEQPRNERAPHVDALNAVEAALAIGAEQDARPHLHDLVGDAEGVHAPRQPEAGDEQQQHADEREQGDEHELLLDDEVDRVALAGEVAVAAEEEIDRAVAEVRDDDAEHDDEGDAAAEEGCRGVQPVPLAVGEVGARGDAVGGGGRGRGIGRRVRLRGRLALGLVALLAHRPARRVSATATRWSRSCSAVSSGRPGMSTPLEAAAVTNLSSARPRARATGPRVMSTSCMRP